MVRFKQRPARWCPVLVGLLVFAASLLLAQPAWADYSVDEVSIDATVASDGTLTIVEDRTFYFDGEYHGVYWNIPEGTYEGADLTPQIGSVGIIEDGTYTAFAHDAGGTDGSFEVTDYGTYKEVKLYSAHTDESATFRIVYTYPDLAQRYQDVGELYWKFVSDGWEVSSNNVTCTIHLPVPSGESVVGGDNVRAWGHGPLDATVAFDGNDIVYSVPGVGTDEFAEARIVFPESWLSAADQRDTEVLGTVLSEEQAWAEQANAQRERARALNTAGLACCIVLSAAFIALSIRALLKERARYRVQFDDEYFRDVPTDDHPAVLDALLHEGEPDGNALTASVMRLSDLGYARLGHEEEEKKGLFGKKKDRYYLDFVKAPEGTSSADDIDRGTLDLLFKEIRRFGGNETGPDGKPRLAFSSIEAAAKDEPERYSKLMDGWQGKLSELCYSKGYLTADNPAKKVPHLCLFLSIVLAVVVFSLWIFAETFTAETALIGLACAAAAIAVSAIVPQKMTNLTPEGREIVAKLHALKRWLLDFTRLKEAVPDDVVLWNRLLVMAVVLGVSEEVIKQLKETQPELYDTLSSDPYSPWYWYMFWGTGRSSSPMAAFGQSIESAHSVSTAALAKSESSSFGGGGGGFSGGGGGGFGGGGGGGAF